MDVTLETTERYFILDGMLFRVRLDRLDQGAEYLRNGTWVWTPITSGGVLRNPHARPVSDADTEMYLTID